jgi:hypothetical protein
VLRLARSRARTRQRQRLTLVIWLLIWVVAILDALFRMILDYAILSLIMLIFVIVSWVSAQERRRPEHDLWREFDSARPHILGALLDAATHGLRALHRVRFEKLPRMADFALWATARETAFWPAGTFAQAYQANRRAAIEDLIDADPVAAWVRQIMANGSTWTGSASDLLRAGEAPGGSRPPERGRGLAQRSPGTCRPIASCADIPSGSRHPHRLRS